MMVPMYDLPIDVQEMYAAYMAREPILGPPAPPKQATIPPDPTKRDLKWGGPYPCLKIRDKGGGQRNWQCGGMMQPARRCFRFEGRLWRKFKCDRCGREATDWKVQ